MCKNDTHENQRRKITIPSASAAEAGATLSVDLDPAANTGKIIHGAAGFLYGVSSEDVPTTNTIVPLKLKILCTKGAVGTEHPYGDALDVAKTFLESGGQQVMMYNSNYYGVFGVTASVERYSEDLKKYICPAVVAWKNAWKEEHGTPDKPKDKIGAVIDIDKAIAYIPINEETPRGSNFYEAWKSYYEAIKFVASLWMKKRRSSARTPPAITDLIPALALLVSSSTAQTTTACRMSSLGTSWPPEA